MSHATTVWIDIENPPQVQYLLPFREAFEAAGTRVVVTACNYGNTVEMLARAGAEPHVFGTRAGRSTLRKVLATAGRTRELLKFFARHGEPDVVLCGPRSAAVAAWRMHIPSFVISDYEYTHGAIYRVTGSTVLYPDVISRAPLLRRGLRPAQLSPFKGLKEDLTFGGVDVDAVKPYDLGDVPANAVRVLFRPPSESCHYYQEQSTEFARAALAYLAREGALVVFAPRDPVQVRLLEGLPFVHDPKILNEAIPFVSLLKSVDAIVCSGGTMLREGAYLGIPSYSIFQSEIGAVDRWLEQIGRVRLIPRPEDLVRIELKPRTELTRLDTNPRLLDELVAEVAVAASRGRSRSRLTV